MRVVLVALMLVACDQPAPRQPRWIDTCREMCDPLPVSHIEIDAWGGHSCSCGESVAGGGR